MDTIILLLVGVAGAGIVLWPLLRSGGAVRRRIPVPALDEAALDREVARYRESLRAGTVCGRCRFANPPESRFCADCGGRLPGA